MASYGGFSAFGRLLTLSMQINPSAQQLNEFFGVSGQQSLWGGLRGRVFLGHGLLIGVDVASLNAAEAFWTDPYTGVAGDGIARVLIDTRFRTWFYVLCETFVADQRVRLDPLYGYVLEYKVGFRGLL